MRARRGALLLLAALAAAPVTWAGQQCNPNVPCTTPTARFGLHADGTATDLRTGLTWRRCAEGQRWQSGRCTGEPTTFTWDDARERFGQPDVAGWRLPSLKELASIAEIACWVPAINPEVFPDTPSAGFWSASAGASGPAYAWYLGFYGGFVNLFPRSSAVRVRLVRAGQ